MSCELSVVVLDNGMWEAIPAYDMFADEFLHLIGRNFPQWSCFYPLGEVVDGD